MSLTGVLQFAQQPEALPEDATAGQAIAGMLILVTLAASIATLVVWWRRFQGSGHALPAAGRGVLRVPFALALISTGLSLLMVVMILMFSGKDHDEQSMPETSDSAQSEMADDQKSVDSIVSAESGVLPAVADRGSEEPQSVEGAFKETSGAAETEESTGIGEKPKISPEKMRNTLIDVIFVDLIILAVLGGVILFVKPLGRVRIPESHDAAEPVPELQSSWTSVLDDREPQPDDSPVSHEEEPFSVLQECRFALEAFLAAWLPTTALRVIIVTLVTRISGDQPSSHPFLEMLDAGAGISIIALIVFTAVVVAPVVEELQFRVAVLGGIAQSGHVAAGLWISSVLFGVVHGFPDGIALLPLAFILGYTYLRRRSYLTVILIHLLFNSFNMAIALLAMI